MKVSFPVMKGNMGGRQYYSLLISLSEIPRLFKFDDWQQCTPELRAQRVLNKARVPDITRYILENEDGYLFSSITASYSCPVKFIPSAENPELGTLNFEFETTKAGGAKIWRRGSLGCQSTIMSSFSQTSPINITLLLTDTFSA